MGILRIRYSPEGLRRYEALRANRVLIVPNHPTNADPAVLFHLGATVGKSSYFLACRESFDAWFGAWGWCIRRLGAYSVVRGTSDKASFKATRDLLCGTGNHVVVFPEGEVYSQNDTLLPYHEGPFQLAFWALESLRKSDSSTTIWIQPVAIKYFLRGTPDVAIRNSLRRLERTVLSPVGPECDDYERLRAIAWSMLRALEHEYKLPPPADDHWNRAFDHRLLAIKESILSRVAYTIGSQPPPGMSLPDRMRMAIRGLGMVTKEEDVDESPYVHRLHRIQRERARPLLRDIERLATFIAIHDGYVAESPTWERYCDTLVRLEQECFGKRRLRRRFNVCVELLDPIDLGGWYEYYRCDKSSCLAKLVHDIESQTLEVLNTMQRPDSE